jgi:hypothetical protein
VFEGFKFEYVDVGDAMFVAGGFRSVGPVSVLVSPRTVGNRITPCLEVQDSS